MFDQFKSWYDKTVRYSLFKSSKYTNVHQVPKLVKIQINQSLGLSAQNKLLEKSIEDFHLICGQHPVITESKQAIAGFKIRKDMPLGVTVTLRRERMYGFLARLIHFVLPQIPDFQGLDPNGMDIYGNYNFGIVDQRFFTEIDYDKIKQTFGFDITLVTTANNREEGLILLKELGMPFQEQ